jgi:hypothetical protein
MRSTRRRRDLGDVPAHTVTAGQVRGGRVYMTLDDALEPWGCVSKQTELIERVCKPSPDSI